MRQALLAGSLVACVALSGCVGKLETRPNREFTPPDAALRGVSYALPKARYEVKLTRALAECPGDAIDGKPTALKFSVSVTATPTMVLGESYTVNYENLPGWLRTATFEIKYHPNGTLKSIGAGAEDKTGEVISSVAKTAFSLATIVGLSSGDAPRTASLPTNIVKCTTEAAKVVKEARQVEADLKNATERLAGYEKDAERLRAAGAARLIDAAGRQRFLALFDDINKAEDEIDRLKKRQGELIQQLGVTEDVVWNGGVTAPDYARPYPLSPAQRSKLAALLEIGSPPKPYPTDEAEAKRQALMRACYDDKDNKADKENCLNQQLALRSGLYLERDLKDCGTEGADAVECRRVALPTGRNYQSARDNVADSGIFVREPIVGRLLFCRQVLLAVASRATVPAKPQRSPIGAQGQTGGSPPGSNGDSSSTGTQGGTLEGGVQAQPEAEEEAAAASEPTCTVAEDEAKIAAADLPQFGQLRFFPLRVGTFQAREMALSLTDTGRIESFTFKSTKAPAQALASTAADVAGQYEAFLEKRETESRDDLKASREEEIAAIQQEIARLTKEAELAKLQTPPEVDPLQATRDETAAIEAELALARAKLERLKTEIELAALQ